MSLWPVQLSLHDKTLAATTYNLTLSHWPGIQSWRLVSESSCRSSIAHKSMNTESEPWQRERHPCLSCGVSHGDIEIYSNKWIMCQFHCALFAFLILIPSSLSKHSLLLVSSNERTLFSDVFSDPSVQKAPQRNAHELSTSLVRTPRGLPVPDPCPTFASNYGLTSPTPLWPQPWCLRVLYPLGFGAWLPPNKLQDLKP